MGKTPQPSAEFRRSIAENPNCVKHFACSPFDPGGRAG
jgi:hypothetical protein